MKRRYKFTSFEEFVGEQDHLNEAGRGHALVTKYVHGIEHPTYPHEQDTAAQDPENHQKSREEEEAQLDPPEDTISQYEEAPILSPSPLVQPSAILDKAVRHPKPQHESQEEEGLLPGRSEDTSLHEEKAPVLDRKGYRELKLSMSDGQENKSQTKAGPDFEDEEGEQMFIFQGLPGRSRIRASGVRGQGVSVLRKCK